MTFIFDTDLFFFFGPHQQPITQQTHTCMWLMHVSGPSHSQQLTVNTCASRQHKKMSGLARVTECKALTKTKKLNQRKVTPFWLCRTTWSLTKDRPALGAKCVGNHHQPLPSSQQVASQTELWKHQFTLSASQTSPAASTSKTSLRQPTRCCFFYQSDTNTQPAQLRTVSLKIWCL